MGKVVAIHQPQYLPWFPYFQKIHDCDIFVFLDNVQYQRRGLQNRNKIKTHSGPIWLTVPVSGPREQLIKEVCIADSKWKKKHLLNIKNNYSKAQFFDEIIAGYEEIISRDFKYLVDLNLAITIWMIKLFDINVKLFRASELDVSGKKDDLIIDICRNVGAATYLSGSGAKAYQDKKKFQENNIDLQYQKRKSIKYSQCVDNKHFIPDLSGIDLLFNVGNNAKNYF